MKQGKLGETRQKLLDKWSYKKFVSKFLSPKVKRFTLWLTTTLIKPSNATNFHLIHLCFKYQEARAEKSIKYKL